METVKVLVICMAVWRWSCRKCDGSSTWKKLVGLLGDAVAVCQIDLYESFVWLGTFEGGDLHGRILDSLSSACEFVDWILSSGRRLDFLRTSRVHTAAQNCGAIWKNS